MGTPNPSSVRQGPNPSNQHHHEGFHLPCLRGRRHGRGRPPVPLQQLLQLLPQHLRLRRRLQPLHLRQLLRHPPLLQARGGGRGRPRPRLHQRPHALPHDLWHPQLRLQPRRLPLHLRLYPPSGQEGGRGRAPVCLQQRCPLPLHLRPPQLRLHPLPLHHRLQPHLQARGRGWAPVLRQLLRQALRLLQDLRLLQLQALLLQPLRLQGILVNNEPRTGLPRISTSTKTKNNTAKNLFQKKPCIKQNRQTTSSSDQKRKAISKVQTAMLIVSPSKMQCSHRYSG